MGLLDMFGKKSPLVDCNVTLSNVPGQLTGIPGATSEGDFAVRFIPDDKKYLLNRNGVANSSGFLDLKVKLEPAGKQAFLQAVETMMGKPVFVSGVMVNDDSQGGKALVQPLDAIYSPVEADQYPAWFKAIQGNLKDPNAVKVYRIVAATDASKSAKPPKTDEARTVHTTFPYPPKPNFPKIKIDFEVRAGLNLKADFRLNNDVMRQRIELDLGIETAKENGPGVFVGDFVAYWASE